MNEAVTEAVLRTAEGAVLDLDVDRWHGPPTPEERRLLAGVRGPVLDVGCGPGRHARALAERGVPALGVDPSPVAAELARARGVAVLQRSIFARIPWAGRWRSALVLDGNVGIGGDPAALLDRVGDLVAPGGEVVAEVAPPGTPSRSLSVRVERGGSHGPWFPWAVVAVEDAAALALAAGFAAARCWSDGGRWFTRLAR